MYILGICLRRPPKSFCTSNVVVFPDPLSPTPSPSLAMKTSENTEEDPDEPEPADEVDFQFEYNSDYLHSPSIGAGTGNYL